MDENGILEFVILAAVAFILVAITRCFIKHPGRSLQNKFERLGNLQGQKFSVICTIAGDPNARSALADGKTLYQWQATGYHLALIFNGDVCEGIQHEWSAN